MQRVALYNNLWGIHHEMYGYILDYISQLTVKVSVRIYLLMDKPNEGWIDFYRAAFPSLGFETHPTQSFNSSDHDIIFLLTDDDWGFTIDNENWNKVVCIDHYYQIRRPGKFFRVSTRFFENRPDDKWVLPVYKYTSFEDKLKLTMCNITRIKVACVGVGGKFDISLVQQHVSNFHEIEFIIMTRKTVTRNKYRQFPNITFVEDAHAQQMMAIVATCHYVLCVPQNINYETQLMSGCIPISFITGCRLIMTRRMATSYALSSPLLLDDIDTLPTPTIKDIENVYIETTKLVNQRDTFFTEKLKSLL